MKDASGTIIYVGKARNLKNRVLSYFHGEVDRHKTEVLVRHIHDLDLMLTRTEVEALLLERTLIRHHHPRFNITLKDDKEYPFVRIDFNEPWPRIEKVRRRRDDNATYVGPFGNAGMLNVMLRQVFRIFPLVRCGPHEFKNAKRPCTYYHMGLCPGPCCLPADRLAYVEHIEHALAALQGKNKELIENLTRRMLEAAAAEQFERAASFRDQIEAIKGIAERQAAVVSEIDYGDAIGLVHEGILFTVHVVMIRDKMIIGGENFHFRSELSTAKDVLSSFLLQYYDGRECPNHLILPFMVKDVAGILEVATKAEGNTPIAYVGEQGEARALLQLAKKNAAHHLQQMKSVQSRAATELEILKEMIGLEEVPRRIECIDVSNLGDTAIVASDVCFLDGKPAKDHYRRYNISEGLGGQNDFGAINEVVKRRLERGLREDDLPDLLVIDGGKGQLAAALAAKADFPNLNLRIVSLAKSRLLEGSDSLTRESLRSDERVFLSESGDSIPLVEGTPAYRILTRIRDEAHRFAIGFHRMKRGKAFTRSVIDEIHGIGPVLKKRLLEHFGGLTGLKGASLEQLVLVPGMKENVAVELLIRLKSES